MALVQRLQDYIAQIHAINIVSCNVPQVLDSLDITVSSVPSLNLYLFELIQNALDAGADSIQIQILGEEAEEESRIGKSLVFEHNGAGGLGETDLHVRGMSNVFQSTKSVGSVGFMGFGFKTLYKRFSTVQVSDSTGWKFKFEVKEESINISEFSGLNEQVTSDKSAEEMKLSSRNWIGAVSPVWDGAIAQPSPSYTTRFELKNLVSSTLNHPLSEDVSEAIFSSSLTPLAALASQGLQSLKILDLNGSLSFQLIATPGEIQVMQVRAGQQIPEIHRFLCYETHFTPSILATKALAQARLKNILKHRDSVQKIMIEIQRPRRVLGIVPLDFNQLPMRQRGQLFACLPIHSFVPFGISLQADWLLDLSRKGLRDISTNAWQQSLLQNVSIIVASFLQSIPTLRTRNEVHRYFSIFGFDNEAEEVQKASAKDSQNPASNSDSPASNRTKNRNLTSAFAIGTTFGSAIARELGDKPVFPVISHSTSTDALPTYMPVGKVVYLPTKYDSDRYIGREHLLNLVGYHLLDSSLLPPESIQFFVNAGLIRTLDISDIIRKFMTAEGMDEWYKTVEATDVLRRQALVELWAFLAQFAPSEAVFKLKCMPAVIQGPEQSQPTESSSQGTGLRWKWESPIDISVFEHDGQYFELPDEQAAKQFLCSAFGSQGFVVLAPSFLHFVLKKSGDWNGPGRIAYEWISKYWSKKSLKILARRSFMTTSFPASDLENINIEIIDRYSASNDATQSGYSGNKLSEVLHFTKWAASNKLASIITHVIPSRGKAGDTGRIKLVEVSLAVLTAPYVESSLSLIHTRLFSQWPTVHPIYAKIHLERVQEGSGATESDHSAFTSNWGIVFSNLGAKGKVELEEYVYKELGVYPSYSESRKGVADILEISHDSVLDFQTTSRNGWKIIDTRFKDVSLGDHPELAPHLAMWLENNLQSLQRADSCLVGRGEVWRTYTAHGKTGTASWCQVLNAMEWVPTVLSSNLVRPFQVLKSQVALSPRLIAVLESKGVYFGRTGAQKALLDQVAAFDASSLSSSSLPASSGTSPSIQDFTAALQKLAFVDPSQHAIVAAALETAIFPSNSTPVPFNRLLLLQTDSESTGSSKIGECEIQALTLGGFLVPTTQLDSDLRDAIERLDRQGIITLQRWPSATSALSFLVQTSHQASSNPNFLLPSYELISIAFDYLAADPSYFRREIKRVAGVLRFPIISPGTPPTSNSSYSWASLSQLAPESLPLALCGTNRVRQMFVRSCLFQTTSQETSLAS
jgi:hypothetical protein